MPDTSTPQQWKVCLFAEQPGRGLAVLAVVAALAWLARLGMDSPIWGGLAVLLLLWPLRSFFLPQWYQLDAEGVTHRTLLGESRLKWPQIRRFDCHGRDGLLATRSRPTPLAALRGLKLILPPDREPVVREIQTRIKEQEATCSSG